MNELEYRVAVANNAARVGNDGLAELRDQAAELGLEIEKASPMKMRCLNCGAMIETAGRECPQCHTDKSESRARQYYLIGGVFGGPLVGAVLGYLIGGGVGAVFAALGGFAVGIPVALALAARSRQNHG